MIIKGCDDHGDWSCDFKFEWALYRAGFKTRMALFHEMKISSYSKVNHRKNAFAGDNKTD
jgi:hypothetical protein